MPPKGHRKGNEIKDGDGVIIVIIFSKGERFEVKVDAADRSLVEGYTWGLRKGYAVCGLSRVGGRNGSQPSPVRMHRILCETPTHVDHVNGDKLDNRRLNLRPSNNRQNHSNRKCHRDGKLVGYTKGHNGSFRAQIRLPASHGSRRIDLGNFSTDVEANAAYKGALAIIETLT